MTSDPGILHTGHWIMVDAFGNIGTFFHSGLSSNELLNPFYTCTQVNILVRGYLLTGDTALLDRAVLHWNRSSRATASDTYPYTNRPAEVAGEVGHFMNSVMLGGIYYADDGELTYVGTLFKAITSLNPNLATPTAPTALTAIAFSSSAIDLHWTDNSNNETGFRIERALASPAAFSEIATVGANVNTFRDTGLAADTLYRYQVRAYNGNGNSAYTTIVQEVTQTGSGGTPPSAPSGLTATAITYSQINLIWTDNSSNETGFRIKRCSGTACTPSSVIATLGPGVTAYSDTTVGANTLYRYTVLAFNAAGDSAETSVAEATTPTTTDAWSVLPSSSLRTLLNASAWIVSPGPDGFSNPVDNILVSWSSGIVFTRPNGEQWLVIKNGGHDSWFYNDVWGYRINGGSPGWQLLRKSYLPYHSTADWDGLITVGMNPYDKTLGTTNNHNVYADDSPGNAHTYDQCGYTPLTDECWWNTGAHSVGSPRQAPMNHFSMVDHLWRYGPSWFGLGMGQFAVTDTLPVGDPNAGHIIIDGTKLLRYNPSTYAVTDLGTSTQPEYVFYSTGRWVNGKMYVFGPKTAVDPDYGNGVFVKVHEPGVPGEIIMNTSGPIIPSYSGPGVDWEPDISRFVIWGGKRRVFLLDPVTGIKTERSVPGSDPGDPIHYTGFSHPGTYKRFSRIGSGQYLLMNSLDEIHKLTLDLAGGPPASTIQLNATASLGSGTSGTTSTGQINCSGSNRYGIVGIIGDNNQGGAGFDDISSVTWGGSAMTLLRKKTSGFPDNDARNMYLYGLVAPPTGLQDITVTTTNAHTHYSIAAAYTGVKQSTQPDATTDNASALPTSSSLTTQLTTVTDEDWMILLEQSISPTGTEGPTAGAGAVLRVTQANYGNFTLFDSNGAIAAGTNYAMTTSRSTSPTSRGITHIMVALKRV